MLILTTPEQVHNWRSSLPSAHRVGFVPTMGALHRGHEVLLQTCLSQNDTTAVSIFVNPTQFNDSTDYDNYPISHERDISLATHHGVDMVYLPTKDVIYQAGFNSFVSPGSTAYSMEGTARPGHFEGVTTVVAKLFNTVQPHRAYFGKKDFQQLSVIRQMTQELNYSIEIVGVETVREDHGLAMSSRNERLTADQRQDAKIIYESLCAAQDLLRTNQQSSEILQEFSSQLSRSSFAKIEYATICDAKTLTEVQVVETPCMLCVAVWYDSVRLIDNIELNL